MRGVEEFRVVPVLLVLLICLHVGVSALPQTAASSGNSSEGEMFEELAEKATAGGKEWKWLKVLNYMNEFFYNCLFFDYVQNPQKYLPSQPSSSSNMIRRGTWLMNKWRKWRLGEEGKFEFDMKSLVNKYTKSVKTLKEKGELDPTLKALIPEKEQAYFRNEVLTSEIGSSDFDSYATYIGKLIDIRKTFLLQYKNEQGPNTDQKSRLTYDKIVSLAMDENYFKEYLTKENGLAFAEMYQQQTEAAIEELKNVIFPEREEPIRTRDDDIRIEESWKSASARLYDGSLASPQEGMDIFIRDVKAYGKNDGDGEPPNPDSNGSNNPSGNLPREPGQDTGPSPGEDGEDSDTGSHDVVPEEGGGPL
eukprot:Nk52_evm6s289 gene=Nk52_evmTU6s289